MRLNMLSTMKAEFHFQRSRWTRSFRPLLKDTKAVAIIETAFALPLILLVGLGGIELAYLVLTHSRISQASLGVADNASRIGATTGLVREVDINEVFTGAVLQTSGMDWAQNGRIILSSLEQKIVKDSGGNVIGTQQAVGWSRCFGGLVQGVQPIAVNASTGMGPTNHKIMAGADTAVMFVEVFYDHRPMVMPNLFGTQRIHYTAAFNVREARDLGSGVANVGTRSSC